MLLISFFLALGFVAFHLFSKHISSLPTIPRSYALSLSGGISVGYVFSETLPNLNAHQENIDRATPFGQVENDAYLIAMIGLLFFGGLEWYVKRSRIQHHEFNGKEVSHRVFWIHMSSFFIFNTLIGYLLLQGKNGGITEKLFFFAALSVHIMSNDISLRRSHKKAYDKLGRWLLSAGFLLGWIISVFVKISDSAISAVFALLSGGMIMNAIKQEFSEEGETSFLAFAAGSIGYSAVWLIVSRIS
ncbi:hypothetical protein ABES25_13645 [Bacillus gobiensis]|uniref:hypothetical protein n=1 Tax=Bacillus gobiensis TaxID=1441095 RepID=UPI003D1F0011